MQLSDICFLINNKLNKKGGPDITAFNRPAPT